MDGVSRQERSGFKDEPRRTSGRCGENSSLRGRNGSTGDNCPFVLYAGTRKLVKRREFEEFIREELVI